jgi:hypothetical protein
MPTAAEPRTDIADRARRLLTHFFTGKTEVQRLGCLRDAFATFAHDPRAGAAARPRSSPVPAWPA